MPTVDLSPPNISSSATAWSLDDLCANDIFFASPDKQWRAYARDGMLSAYRPVTRPVVQALMDQAVQRGVTQPVLFGLIPFDVHRPASLSIPFRLQQQAGVPSTLNVPAAQAPAITQCIPVPPAPSYGEAVRQAVARMDAKKGLRKIVLSRTLDITLDRPLNSARLLTKLLAHNRHGYTFTLPMWGEQNTQTPIGRMLGASPELLVHRAGDRVRVNPLAGSIGRAPDPEEDARRCERLANSEKDRREHAYVVDHVVRVLRAHCTDLHVPPQPSVISTDTLWHLSTVITGRLRHATTTALDLSFALHPTPAVCGTPTAMALQQLAALEPFDREYYCGLVGWQHINGDGQWVLALRCARHTDAKQLRLYAGAGIVSGSVPEQEIVETTTKLETFLRALH